MAALFQPPNLRWNILDDTGFMCARGRYAFNLVPFLLSHETTFSPLTSRNLLLFHANTCAWEHVELPISGADVEGEGSGGGGRFIPEATRRLLIPFETTLVETKVRYTPEIPLMQLWLRRWSILVQMSGFY